MGGDHAPREMVRGAALAARALGVRVALVGRIDALEAEVGALPAGDAAPAGSLSLVAAASVVEMKESPAQAVRAKKDASVVVACDLVASGRARAAVSAGNSGATLAAALLSVHRLTGVARPAIGIVLPTAAGPAFMLDVGANTDCRPEWLAQFAVMGSVYAEALLHVEQPRVALLSNGEERGKGSELVQAATALLETAPVRFVGNVEGRDIFRGACDVVVCDGFSGNVALKVAEGVGEFLFAAIATEARRSVRGRLGGLLLRPRLRPLRDRLDYRRTGGALLLGVAGEVVIAHGRSDALAVMNAIRVARDAAELDVSGTIARRLAGTGATSGEDPAVNAPAPAEEATART